MAAPLVIAGGGPAGLACGIRLLEAGRAVTLHERGRYPLRKVCGEFLSPRAWQRVQALGADAHLALAPLPLKRARFYADGLQHADLSLEPAAYGLSRAALDTALARRFQALGGDLREGSAWDGTVDVDARGRPSEHGAWMGYKAYLPAGHLLLEREGVDLLMLPLVQGYAGIAKIEDGRLSVCLIARAPAPLKDLLGGHPLLAEVADDLETHAAIAGFNLESYLGRERIGDRRRVWPPVVGDGISRALADGEAKAAAILGGRGPARSRAAFGVAKALHGAMLRPFWRRGLARLCRTWPGLATALYRRTRV
jgi:hypothetical protein